ncbi:MAG TPA: pyridoxal-dependent decarboxylase [Puia sp.]|nr:pyridoxal-dependent decarboxylase [Puia sp.]
MIFTRATPAEQELSAAVEPSAEQATPIDLREAEFKKIGYGLIDTLARFMGTIGSRPVTRGEKAGQLAELLGYTPLPELGIPAEEIFSRVVTLLLDHSLLNGHPKFMGYITSSPAPAGALADLLASAVNPNVGAEILSPMATAIEKQTIRWLAEFIGVSKDYGGILVSGGNMANFTAFLAARTAKAKINIKEEGLASTAGQMTLYCSRATHTWIEKAAALFGHGARAIRWIPTDTGNRMDPLQLEIAIKKDKEEGRQPFIVVATAGDVSTGAVDNLLPISSICKTYDCWFHIDGAYGIPAAAIPELRPLFEGMGEADSIALDPHKWLYSPLEAGCTLVKNPRHLTDTYSSHPEYYNFGGKEGDAVHNYYEYGLQNSRGFRALKVWITLQQAGRTGYINMISKDIQLSRLLFQLAEQHPRLEAVTQHLSITTFRYMPAGMPLPENNEAYLNRFNEALLNKLQQGGEVFLSNAIVNGKYCLRSCIVNFRTSKKDVEEIVKIVAREGEKLSESFENPV